MGGWSSGPSKLTGWMSIIGLCIGSIAMILSIAVLNGFENRVIEKIIGFESDIRLTKIEDFNSTIDIVNNINGVKSVMPFQERKGLVLAKGGVQRMVTLKAIEIEKFTSFYDINSFTKSNYGNQPIVYLGEMTARRLNVREGEVVRLLSPIDHGYSWGMPTQIQCVVGGIFNIQVLDLDDKIAFIPLEIGEKLFIRKSNLDGMDVRLFEGDRIDLVANELRNKILGAKVETWGDLHQELFGAMRFERIGTLIVLSLIIVVACFNLVTTLVLVVAQKTREFGILQVLGSNKKTIESIVMYQGGLISSFGIVSGLIIGLFFVYLQNIFGIIPLPEDIYFTSSLPMVIFLKDIIAILTISIGMVMVSIYISTSRTIMLSSMKSIYLDK
ncbi:MAG: FtsX-like permease family protein [Candidatus Neomarinimicrobiota bacterium]|nr:FtsX-like permease family protein [Candidatus Neomarinimicrobiota bacterium]